MNKEITIIDQFKQGFVQVSTRTPAERCILIGILKEHKITSFTVFPENRKHFFCIHGYDRSTQSVTLCQFKKAIEADTRTKQRELPFSKPPVRELKEEEIVKPLKSRIKIIKTRTVRTITFESSNGKMMTTHIHLKKECGKEWTFDKVDFTVGRNLSYDIDDWENLSHIHSVVSGILKKLNKGK